MSDHTDIRVMRVKKYTDIYVIVTYYSQCKPLFTYDPNVVPCMVKPRHLCHTPYMGWLLA